MTTNRAAAAAATAALLFSLAACGGSDTTKTVAEDSAPALVTLPTGLTFEVPGGWDELSLDVAADAASDATEAGAFDELADNMGITPEQLAEQTKSLDVFVAAPDADDGFLSNINALHYDQGLQSSGAIELQYRSLGAKDIEVDEVETDAGEGRAVTYTLTVNGVTIKGGALVVAHDGQTTVLTVSTGSADTTEDLVEHLVDTLAVAD